MKNKMNIAIFFIFLTVIIFTLFACARSDSKCAPGNHRFGEWKADTTDSSVLCHDRTYSATCAVCGEVETVKGGMGWHEFTYDDLAPTCIAEGYSKCNCTVCGYSDMFTIPIDASAHKYDDTYHSDAIYHWKECLLCNAVSSTEAHETNEEQYCEICECFVGPSIGIVYEISEDGSYAMVTDYLSGITSIEIAQYYENIPVKVIKADAFKDKRIVSVTIPNSVTTIESGAFTGCTSLKSIILPESVITIGDNAFKGCTKLGELSLSCGVVTIGSGAFQGCTALKKITLPNSVKTIGDQAFYNCTSITEIDFEHTVTSIGKSAFENCNKIKAVILPDSVISIGDSAFKNCLELQKLTVGSGVKNVGRYAFDNCHEYLYFVTQQGKYVGDSVNLCTILIEFLDKDWWDGHEINNKTRIIASGAYDQSYYLNSVIIPESVTSISDEAFSDCQSLTSVYYLGTPDDWKNVEIGTGNGYLLDATVEYDQ